jgi:asparagine synthase (glutamine-hydrolysing)
MSAQFGVWSFDGEPIRQDLISGAERLLSAYGSGHKSLHAAPGLAILCLGHLIAGELTVPMRSHLTSSDAILTWDGRLDNRVELIERLGVPQLKTCHDDVIVAAAYKSWGERCLAELVGDWAISLLNPKDNSLTIARDVVGTRHLFFTVHDHKAYWCTRIEPLVLLTQGSEKLDEEYLAGWLGPCPAAHLTPYQGIHSVLPSTFVRITKQGQHATKYWDFAPAKRVRYSHDREYEEHFRSLFATAVRRRLTSDGSTLAELSGGMDSSAIVCMADHILVPSAAGVRRIKTVSYFDDSEPNWNERPFVTAVEAQRGLEGHHINVDPAGILDFASLPGDFPETPMSCNPPNVATRQFASIVEAENYRVVLSGIGGDEVMGGVPTPIPELADLAATWRISEFLRRSRIWARNKKQPWIKLALETGKEFLPNFLAGQSDQIPSWLEPSFIKKHRNVLSGYRARKHALGALPSFQENLQTLDGLRRQLNILQLPREPYYERRYPFLDRDLLEFLYAIPREQHLRPGQRRSLMRRALRGIVPDEILDRKRKAYVDRGPLLAITREWTNLCELVANPVLGSLGVIRPAGIRSVLEQARQGRPVPLVSLLRTLMVELWLQRLCQTGKVEVPSQGCGPISERPNQAMSCSL